LTCARTGVSCAFAETHASGSPRKPQIVTGGSHAFSPAPAVATAPDRHAPRYCFFFFVILAASEFPNSIVGWLNFTSLW
jgi:hypothetical protein